MPAKLPQNATIILDSCELGKGAHYEYNFANFVAENVKPSTRIFSATDDTTGFEIVKQSPLEIQFLNSNRQDKASITYKIDGLDDKHKDIDDYKILNQNNNAIITNIPGHNSRVSQ
ncbi:MAG: hypothetical protein H0W50_09825 [Parachlamydiaceae bacterium]|nr:hypothetical protein [Parachlamydiaceae bacterium]